MFAVFSTFRLFAIFRVPSGGAVVPGADTDHLLLESGDALMLESGDNILLESA